MLLRIVRRIPKDSNVLLSQSIFGFINRRDLDGLKWALQTKKVCVYDVMTSRSARSTYTALTWAIISEDVPIAKLLIDAGSEVSVGSDYVSPIQEALYLFSEGAREGKSFLEMLPIDEFLEASGFSDLHRIVLGFLPLNLRESLQKPHLLAQINQCTKDGQTPLHWAAARGDAATIKTLIEAGATVNIRALSGRTPLLSACYCGNLAAVRALQDAGAAIDCRDKALRTCLHIAAQSRVENLTLLSFLISRGANVNAQTSANAGPLDRAVMANRPKSVSLLLQQGANASNRDSDGNSPLLDAITVASHESARILLDYGADYTNINNYGWGILHTLAAEGDLRMIRLFIEVRMRGLDPKMRGLDGKTPIDLFEERWDHNSSELRAHVKALLESLVDHTSAVRGKGKEIDLAGESSDEDFYDASDTW